MIIKPHTRQVSLIKLTLFIDYDSRDHTQDDTEQVGHISVDAKSVSCELQTANDSRRTFKLLGTAVAGSSLPSISSET